MVSRLRAAPGYLRLMPYCIRLTSSPRCMLSIDSGFVWSEPKPEYRSAACWHTGIFRMSVHQWIFWPYRLHIQLSSYYRPISACLQLWVHRRERSDTVFNTISQGAPAGLEFYQEITFFFLILSMMHFCMDMASAVTTFPDMSILSRSNGSAIIPLLFSRQAPVANMMPVVKEYADTISGLRPFSWTVPRPDLLFGKIHQSV